MYAWLFRHLPGPLPVRVLLTLVLLAAVLVGLFGWGFPALAPHVTWLTGDPSLG